MTTQKSAEYPCAEKLQFNSDDVHVYGVYDHARESLYLIFNGFFQGLCNGIDRNAVFDDDVHVHVNSIARRRYLNTFTAHFSFGEQGQVVGETTGYHLHNPVRFECGVGGNFGNRQIGYGNSSVSIICIN